MWIKADYTKVDALIHSRVCCSWYKIPVVVELFFLYKGRPHMPSSLLYMLLPTEITLLSYKLNYCIKQYVIF